MSETGLTFRFDRGTLLLDWNGSSRIPETVTPLLEGVTWDERVQGWRAPAWKYRELILSFPRAGLLYQDQAREFQPIDLPLRQDLQPRPYQQEAAHAWLEQQRGVVVLPTGAGKTILAVMLISRTARPTLIHVPTLDLMRQWHTVLQEHFACPIGLLGGGVQDLQPITVATYDSALIHVPQIGNRFGLLVFDECHHLPGDQVQFTALGSIAPFRLGLTATPERSDGREEVLYELCGPLCYEAHIDELQGRTLAPYDVQTVQVQMLPEEEEAYWTQREKYTQFLRQERIDMRGSGGWKNFLWKSSRSVRGREAFQAYLAQKRLSQASAAKEEAVWNILRRHAQDRIIIFTQDNETAYRLGRNFFLPVLTHHTKLPERQAFLQAFREGEYPVLVTSKVLNEGVDVPEANVGVVVSGSGSIREHVQRLGRILRGRPGKRALLYELVSRNTGEQFVNKRRRQHRAYERSGSLPGT